MARILFVLFIFIVSVANAEEKFSRCDEKNSNCLASVTIFVGPPQNAAGSGVVISRDGLILTNAHVIGEIRDVGVMVRFEKNKKEKFFSASIVDVDYARDLALLWVPKKMPFVKIGKNKNFSFGKLLYIISSPDGKCHRKLTRTIFVSKGIFWDEYDVAYKKMQLAQLGRKVISGSSGGGVFDQNGKLVGLVQRTGNTSWYIFAIPVETIRAYLGSLRLCTPAINYCVSR